MHYPKRKTLACAVMAAWAYAMAAQAADTAAFWHDKPSTRASMAKGPSTYRAMTLDLANLQTELDAAASAIRRGQSNNFALPLPEGGMTYFTLSESDVLPAELARRYPQIRSYKGVDAQGRRLRLDFTPEGLQAMVYGDKDGVWLVQRSGRLAGKVSKASASGDEYWSFRRDSLPPGEPFREKEAVESSAIRLQNMLPSFRKSGETHSGGTVLYNYRLAMAATSTYTRSFGNTVADGLGAIVTMVNRINEIYENDLGVHLTLIPDEDKIIYTDAKTDPYSGKEPGSTPINQANVDNLGRVIGNKNFDVGHVVAGNGSGGRAEIGSTCGALKAFGSTGRKNPSGDAFVVDFVAHELGHSFGSGHTFNARRSTVAPEDAVEPGEGSTIMGYAGIYGGDISYQVNSDPYFNSSSIERIQGWIAGDGGRCAKRTPNRSRAPAIDTNSLLPPDWASGRKRYTIPARTPFTLNVKTTKGSNTSPLTYTWEQFDFGPEQSGNLKDDGKGPIFRSFKPHAESEQSFPHLAAVLGDEPLGNGQVYPATNRRLSFRVTVRDNARMSEAMGVGANTVSAKMYLDVLNTGSAFAVTQPNAAVEWNAGSEQTIAWNVAKTNERPIACANVKLDLSTDGGFTYQTKPLLDSTPNTGTAKVTLPKEAAPKARIRISCTNNVFFAVTPAISIKAPSALAGLP